MGHNDARADARATKTTPGIPAQNHRQGSTVIHKILDKIDRMVAQKRQSGELQAWFDSGLARRYCKQVTASQKHYYPALLLYLERHAGHH